MGAVCIHHYLVLPKHKACAILRGWMQARALPAMQCAAFAGLGAPA